MSLLLAIVLVAACCLIHYEVLWRLNRLLPSLNFVPRRALVLLAMLGAFCSHFCHVALFASAYFCVEQLLGSAIGGENSGVGFGDLLYFSTETYTSLGFGDIYPRESLRLLVGIESITGLLMIGWTTSFTYLEMKRYWTGGERNP